MSRLAEKLRRDSLDEHFAQLVATALMESGRNMPAQARSAGGDPRRLRGIPVIGRGVGGTSPGTAPEGVIRRLG